MANKWTVQARVDKSRQYKNGEFWHNTPEHVQKNIMFNFPFIGVAMVAAERYYLSQRAHKEKVS
jgi:hypothetical protein